MGLGTAYDYLIIFSPEPDETAHTRKKRSGDPTHGIEP